MTVIEIGCMGVRPGLDVMNDNTPEGKVLPTAYNTVTVTPGGPYNAFWGLQLEDPTRVWTFFEFDSVEAHMEFGRLHGAEIVKDLPSILTFGFMKHLALTSSASIAFKSPLTEIIFVHFPGDTPGDKQEEVTEQLSATLSGLAICPAIRGVSWGWGVENDFPFLGQEEHAGQVFAVALGWQGITEQQAFTSDAVFRNFEATVRGISGVAGLSKVRVSLRGSERKME
ncbi:hypothetical protein CPLU01_13090 [Colletotrichum plurivorum]|uniref:ABM domain-containing protein n=1 Tax=Colletotrichum plurivorum TaxID=2175906 RepID=A0A8H6N4J1_9PEZI|nr:hypothetical protein CPLU01_13090 [Colletotrichum plurivorum]